MFNNIRYILVSILLISIFSGCKKSGTNYCINALDCPDGYECEQGICVEKSGNDGFSSQPDNSVNDNYNYPDNNTSPDSLTDETADEDADEEYKNDTDSENTDGSDTETGDDDCTPNSCGNFCSNVVTNECNTKTDCRCEPVLHFSNMADPDICRDSDELYFISGTGADTNSLVISMSSDLVTFEEAFTYTPSAIDPNYDYCCIWAPDIYLTPEGMYNIYFSAKRVAQGEVCDCADVSNVTTFSAQYDETATNFLAPSLVDFGEGNPQSRVEADCSVHGCERTIRIDSSLFNDEGTEWFFWTWFESGNNISSMKISDPSTVFTNFQPSGLEGSINEAPDVFKRNDKYYMFLSVNSFDANYAMKYVVADSLEECRRERVPRWFSTPVMNSGGYLIETHGHSSVVERYGDHYIFYHQGVFDIPGTLSRRDTYKSRLHFRDDGSLHTLNTIDIRWSDAGEGYEYSLDLLTREDELISSCLGAATLGSLKKYTFTGLCKDSSDAIVHKGSIKKIRLFYSNDGVWGEPNMVEVDYDGFSSDISIKIPDKNFDHLKIRFAQQRTGDIYSIDLKLKDSGWIAPCIGSLQLSKPINLAGDFAYTFNGTCLAEPNNGTVVPIENIESIRICSDKDDNWMDTTCFEKAYDGLSRYIEVW